MQDALTQDLLFTMPEKKKSPSFRETAKELMQFKEVFEDENGLVPRNCLHEALGVSAQRIHQLIKEDEVFHVWTFFKREWCSAREVEAFGLLERKGGRQWSVSNKDLWKANIEDFRASLGKD